MPARSRQTSQRPQDGQGCGVSRFPFPAYPNSWYAVAWSHEVPAGTVQPIRYFGQDLVVFRGHDGQPHVLDAHCPHLGAHLGVGGRVVGNELECPFHAWRFAGDGQCVHIPYADHIPGKARVACWPVHEINGQILTYYDADKRAPAFTVPVAPGFGQPGWCKPTFHSVDVRTRVQEMNENIFDLAHFVKVHHYADMPTSEIHIDGPHVRVALDGFMDVLGRLWPLSTDNDMHGAGWTVIHVKRPFELVVLVGKTPLDEETVRHRFAVCVRQQLGPLRSVLRYFVTRLVIADVHTDARIWENKRHLERPLLVKVEAPIHTFRQWHKQFHEPIRALKKSTSGLPAEGTAARPPRNQWISHPQRVATRRDQTAFQRPATPPTESAEAPA